MISYDIKQLKYILLLLPFFEPFSVSLLSANSMFWQMVGDIFAASRYAVSIAIIIWFFSREREPQSVFFTGELCIGFAAARILASAFNGSLYSTFAISIISYIGLLVLCKTLFLSKGEELFQILYELFALFCIPAVITIFLFPNGFNNAATKAEAIYFLGSKNSSFYYFYAFLCTWIISCLLRRDINSNRNTFFTIIAFAVFIIAAFRCDSSNSVGTLLILLVFYLLIRFSKSLFSLAKPGMLLAIITVLALILLLKNNIQLLNTLFSLLGRDSSLSGRDYIWAEQISLIKDAFLWGNGIDVKTILQSSAIATHAHNFYLDTIVKYGAASLFILIILITNSFRNLNRFTDPKLKSFLAGTIFTLLLHSLFDDLSLYVLFTVLMFTEYTKLDNSIISTDIDEIRREDLDCGSKCRTTVPEV